MRARRPRSPRESRRLKFGSAPVCGALSLGVAGLDRMPLLSGAQARRHDAAVSLARDFDVLVKTVEAFKWETLLLAP